MGIEQGTVRRRCRLLLFESELALTAHSMFVGLWRWI